MDDSEFIRRLRHRIDTDPTLSAAGLSIAAGLDNSVIRNLFNGKTRNPRPDTMEKICAALGTTVDEFMKPAQSPEEAEIARLVSALPAPLRLQLLGFAKALAAEADQSRPKEGEGDE